VIRRLLFTLRKCLRDSARFHVRDHEIESLAELIDLLDRFLDDDLSYPLEWDDFISWKNPNPSVERVRDRIADLERQFVGTDQERTDALAKVREMRDQIALSLGRSKRR
jgi:hypothetical protein